MCTRSALPCSSFIIISDATVAVSGAVDLNVLGDQYAAYRIAGPAIERVEFVRISLDGTSVGINKQRRGFTRAEADRVAQRLTVRWLN